MGKKPNAIIIDLDGTLCNNNHRRHLVEKEKKEWGEFMASMIHDTPNDWCAEIIKLFQGSNTADVIYVTGRDDSYYDITRNWLFENNLWVGRLYMRRFKDYRKDTIVKKEIYHSVIAPNYNILFAIDDRQQVVDMWRSLGITCLQCDVGDF